MGAEVGCGGQFFCQSGVTMIIFIIKRGKNLVRLQDSFI